MKFSRRHIIASGFAATASARPSLALSPLEIGWEDLIPPGVPYSEIIGEGDLDEANDTWSPIFDANATKLNEGLDGAYIRMPGYILPLEIGSEGITEFILVPYIGACIHTPPPPPNQLVFAKATKPWPGDQLWDAVWVSGTLRTRLQSTAIAQTGYALSVDTMETYEW
ncbi:MAG: DUF3299 domain-containing protein [Rhodobacteraceae bacterium]|nr:DUF3299 domain-containing protein [Paracoccaceae bacterium]